MHSSGWSDTCTWSFSSLCKKNTELDAQHYTHGADIWVLLSRLPCQQAFCYPTTWKKEKGSSHPRVMGNLESIWNGKSMKDVSLNWISNASNNNNNAAHLQVLFMPSPLLRSHSPFSPCLPKMHQSNLTQYLGGSNPIPSKTMFLILGQIPFPPRPCS